MREYETREIIRIADNNVSAIDEPIVAETCVALKLNGAEATRFFCTPSSLEHLATGWLRSKGIITCTTDVEALSVDLDSKIIVATVDKTSCAEEYCSSEEMKIPASQIELIFRAFNASSELFHKTGGAHSCAVLPMEGLREFDGRFPVIFEDVGRHNAVLKAIGSALTSGIFPNSAILLFSGRLALEIVDTAAALRFPVVLSAGAPTLAAVDSANKNGVTLAGFIKPGKINVYTHPHRIDYAV